MRTLISQPLRSTWATIRGIFTVIIIIICYCYYDCDYFYSYYYIIERLKTLKAHDIVLPKVSSNAS